MSDSEHIEQDIGVFDVDTATGPVGSVAVTRNRWCNLTIRAIFSTPGLVVLVIVYSVLGALIFPLLEARHGNSSPGGSGSSSVLTMSISKSREDCLKELWTITERLNVLYERNWTMLVHEQLRRFEGSIVAATKGRLGRRLVDPSTAAAVASSLVDDGPGWSFKESLLYSVTVITTIGHGNMTPRTAEGKLVTMFYALFGVPLMLMCLSSLGGLLAEALQCAYCRVCQRGTRRNGNHLRGEENAGGGNGSRRNKLALTNGCAMMTTTTTKKAGLRGGKGNAIPSHSETDCDGRSCKYDYMPVGSDSGTGQNNNNNHPSAMPYHQTINPAKPQVEEGNIYTGSPKHVTSSGTYLGTAMHNSYSFAPAPQHHHGVLHSVHNAPQMSFHPPNLLMDTGTPFGTPTKKFILAEMPIEYTQLHHQQQQQQQHHQQQQHQTLQDAVSNVSYQQQHQQGLHNANGLLASSGNCVILLNPNNSRNSGAIHNSIMLGKSTFMPKPLPQEINLLIAESSEMDCQQQQQQQQQQQLLNSLNYTPGTMDDDEEDNRSCPPHGTPSRIPLIKRSGNNSPLKVSFSDTCKKSVDERLDHHSYGKWLNRSEGDYRQAMDPELAGEDEDDEDGAPFGEPMTQVPMLLIFFILLFYISLGTIIFAVWEDWSVIDGAYFCFVTLSTIGFGDLVPLRTFRGPELQLFACFLYLLLGLVLVAMTFTVVENQLMWKCRRVAVRLKLTKS